MFRIFPLLYFFLYYQAYEIGKAVPTLQNFIKLADLYDVSLDYLIGRKEL